jgi:thiamine pyrophosphate-dependent acetolactate synthase large subunit-like protein
VSALDRREVVRTLLRDRGDLLVVAGLGSAAYDLAAAGDCPLDFPLWGAMGGATMVGLGLALAQPERAVLVVTGDGELLMGLGSLATIAAQRPANLRIVVLDNGRFGETGQQETHTALGADLTGVARACGFSQTFTVEQAAEVEGLRERLHAAEGPLFAVVKVAPGDLPRTLPPRDGAYLTQRTREALLGMPRALEG